MCVCVCVCMRVHTRACVSIFINCVITETSTMTDSCGVDCSAAGVANGGYSNPVDSTSLSPTSPSFNVTYNNLPNGNARVNLTNPEVSPDWTSQQHIHQFYGMTHQHSMQYNMMHNHMPVNEPKHLHSLQPGEQPPAYNPNGAPYDPPPAYFSPSINIVRPQQYPSQPPFPQQYPQQYPQPQQQVSVFQTQQTAPAYVVQPTPYRSYGRHIALACVTFWFCGVLFGLIAFIFAGM